MPAPDTVLQGRYRIVRQLGRGGMGAVYEAVDERLSRTVALKETLAETDDLKRAFEREARLLANLSHPALPKVIDHFTEDDGQFVVMEFIPGSDLGEQLERRGQPFSHTEALRWANDLLDALEYLHTHEPPIIHRDIKPSNLKLTSKGRIILLDFGLAKGAAGQMTRTTSGMSVIGYTLHYAALEQIQGERTGPRSDLYSLAATLYQLLTGSTPVDALKRAADLLNDEADPLTPIRALNPSVPAPFAEVLMQALSIKPSLRPASAADMRVAFNDAPAVFAHVAPVEEDEMTRVSVTPGRSGRLPQIAIGGDKTMVMASPPTGARLPAPNGAGYLKHRRTPLDAPGNARKWWILGGGATLAVIIIVGIVLLALRSGQTNVTPATAPTANDAIPSPYREALSSVATLTMQDAEGKTIRQASGFFLTTDELATSLSAIEGAARGRVALVGQTGTYDITNVTGVDREHGVVILKVSKAKASGLGFSSKKQSTMGDKVALLGSGAKAEPAYAPGSISSYRDDDRVEIGAQAPPTVAGGPLLNAEGEVIGIVTDSNGSRVLAVPVSYLADLFNHKQQPVSIALAGAKDVLYDWRKHDPIAHPELAKDLERKIIAEVARAHDKAPAPPTPTATPQGTTPAEGAQTQTGGFWEDEMSSATITGMAEGSFTAQGAKQTAYIIDTHTGTAANNGGPKYLAIFSGETYVTDVPVPNLSLIVQTSDLNHDEVNELLVGYYYMQAGQVMQWAKLVQVTQGQLRIIRDFGTTFTSSCEVAPERNPGSYASVIFYASAAAGQMPEMRVDNYQAACPPEGAAEQWKYASVAKLPELSNK